MVPLLTAIQSFLAGNAGIAAAFPGGFWEDITKEQAAMPYLVLTVVASPNRQFFGSGALATDTIRFTAVGYEPTVGTAMTMLIDNLTNQILTLGSGNGNMTNNAQRTDPAPSVFKPLDQFGNKVYRYDVLYDFSVGP